MLFICCLECYSQKGITTIGFQVKPIVPMNYFGAGDFSISDVSDSIETTINISTKLGYSFGMVVRHGFTKSISIESGINYTRRNYQLTGSGNYKPTGSTSFINTSDETDFGFVSYEIPIQGLIYIRLGERIYMNVAAGIGINFYASDVESLGKNTFINHHSEKARWINLSFLSNLGLEYRTEKSGIIYLGASLNIPFNEITVTRLRYEYTTVLITKFDPVFLNGNYFTIDLRYFLPPNNKTK